MNIPTYNYHDNICIIKFNSGYEVTLRERDFELTVSRVMKYLLFNIKKIRKKFHDFTMHLMEKQNILYICENNSHRGG